MNPTFTFSLAWAAPNASTSANMTKPAVAILRSAIMPLSPPVLLFSVAARPSSHVRPCGRVEQAGNTHIVERKQPAC
jgi:hypothetical protein